MTTPTALKALGDESYDTGTLEYGKAYYWRVDEVNDSDPCTWKGSVWSFSTENGKASDPSPFDGKRGIAPGPVYLRWTPPCYVTAQTLHYGTTFPQDGTWTSVALGASDDEYQLTVGQFEHYYWRVDTTAGALGVITGDTWDFTTGVGGVLMYYKFDGTGSFPSTITDDSGRGVQFTKDLSGGGTLSYGESNPGMDTSTASAYFDANVGLYRNDTGETDVLRLSGSEYTIEMWTKAESWTDGSGVFLISKRGSWGLEIHTDNDFEFRFQGGGGDTGNDSVTLDEWYHVAVIYDQADEELSGLYLDGIKEDGSGGLLPPDNNNPIWIGVDQRSDGSFRGHFDGLIDDLRIHDVALSTCALLTTSKEPGYPICPWPEDGGQDINPDGVVLSWSAGEGATSHVVYFGTEQADVENLDISTYLDEYSFAVSDSLDLEYGTTYYWRVVEQPGGQEGEVWRFTTEFLVDDENLRLHYKLDESSGETAYDSSGYGNHGDLDERGDGWRPSDGQSGGSFSFDDDNRIDAPDFATSTLASTVSISCWLKDSFSPGADNFVFGIGTGPYQIRATVPSSDGRSVEWRAGNDSNDVLVWDMFLDSIDPRTLSDWHHWVFVKDEGIGMQIYFDGELVDSNDVVNTTVIRLRSSELSVGAGSGHDSDLVGKVDDFRLYDIALDADQVSGLFRGGELELAWSPSPRSGAADVDQDVLLSWRPGDYAIEHDVYVGETYSEVADANTATVGIYKGRQLDMNYPLGASLSLGSIRYWRIDEVNDFDVNSPWKGKVWKFTVADYVTIDDMESYDPFVNRIWQKWDNPWGTGSFVDLGQAPFTPVNRGGNSMEYLYDNFIKWDFFSYWSEVEYNFDSSRNWTDAGVKLMTLFFYGDPTNAVGVTEQLSVGVAGTSTRVDVDLADMNDLLEEEWHEWNIELAEFAAAPLTAVDTVFLRFGDSSNTDTPGGEGVVYFDDIRLYPPKCVPEFGPVYDFSGDCLVGLAELRMLGEEWLLQDMLIATVTAPDPCVLHYAFDESSGSTVADSAGSYTGSVFDDVDQTPADITARMDAGMSGNSLHFSAPLGYMGISVPNDVFVDNGISDEITVAVWLKNAYPSESPDGGAFMWEFREWDGAATIGGDRVLAVETTDDGDTYTLHDSSRWVSYGLNWPGQTEWTHYAFVRDASNLSIYVNGLLEAVAASSGGAMATPGLLYVGISADLAPGNAGGLHDGFTGNMEDFMIFDYALSDDEAGYLGTQGTGYIPMQPATMNLVNDEPDGQKVVNFRDYAELTLYWLDEILWPE